MNILKQVFSENSKVSLMRIMSASIIATSLGIIIYQALSCDAVDWTGCCSLCALGLSGKAGQKYLEREQPTKGPINS